MVSGAGRETTEKVLARPFWVCLCLLGGGGRAAGSSYPLLTQLACLVPGGQGVWHSYCLLVQMPVCLRFSCLLPLGPTGVAGRGAGWGPG